MNPLVLGIAAQGVVSTAATGVLFVAQVDASSSLGDTGTIVTGGAFMSMVTFLLYLVRKLADGQLVSVKLERLVASAERREEKLIDVLDRAHEREQTYQRLMFTDRAVRTRADDE